MPELSPDFPLLEHTLCARVSASRWYVAYSGGLDSTVLLYLVHAWCQSHPEAPQLVAWHVNHGMQAAAQDWQRHCASVCTSWGIPFRADPVSVTPGGRGVEAAAREARYTVFEEGLAEGEILWMAHHLDDQVETFFLRLMRGAGLQGMSGMPGERALGRGLLLRPLLDVRRESLETTASQCQLPFVDDPSNRDTSLDRNFLRQELLPLLAERWGGYRKTVTRASGHMAAALSMLEDNQPDPVTVFSSQGDPGLPVRVLVEGSGDSAAIYLRAWLRGHRLPIPGLALMSEFLRQLKSGGGDTSPRLDCGGYVLQRFGDAVYRLPEPRSVPPKSGYLLAAGGECDVAGIGTLSLCPAPVAGIALAAGEVVDITWRRGGERCRPRGRAHSQTLKKLLLENGVPPWWRTRIPLLRLNGEILAVGDLWLCESSRLRRADESDETVWQLHWKRNSFVPVD